MADYEATGGDLQKLVLLGKKRPMPFAFCPSSGGDSESLFATHRKKPPEIIAKAARKAAGQTKVCFGTFTVEAKLMTLVLIKELPSIAKKLKKHLRQERLSLNVRVVDVMGNELEADIEDLPEDTTLDGEADEDASTEAVADIAEPEATQDDADEDLPDPKALIQQLKDLQPGIMALQGDAGNTLRTAIAVAVGLLKANQLVRAESTINAIGRAFARQVGPTSPQQLNALALAAGQKLNTLRGQAEQLQGPAKEKLMIALDLIAQQIGGGDMAKAAQTMNAVEQAIIRSKAAGITEAETAPKPPPEKLEAAQKWAELVAKLEPMVFATIKAGIGDIDAVKRGFDAMLDQAAAGKHQAAISGAPALAQSIRAAEAATQIQDGTQTQDGANIPADFLFLKMRLVWVNTRAKLRAEIETLRSAMDATLSAIDGMEEAVSETGKLFTYIDALDTRLETTLEAIARTPDGPERQTLLAKARAVVAEYSRELDSDFFRDVDGDNGFAPVKVRAPAVAALLQISAALAA